LSRSPLRRWAGPAIAGSLALVGSVLPVVATAATAASPGLVISQVYGAGGNAGAVLANDYVELFNRSSAPVSTAGMSVQYASATGTGDFQAAALTPVEVPAGGYHLVRLAGGSVGSPVPAADSTGTLNLSGSAGKVVLADGLGDIACNGGSSTCTPEESGRIVDLVGFGTANFFEGSAAAPGLSPTTAALRAGAGCTDTDQNSADLTAGAPAPRNAATAPAPCGGVPGGPTTPTPSCPETVRTDLGTGATAPVSATDADSRVTTATLTAPPAGVTLAGFTASTADGAPGAATLTVGPATAAGTYQVEVVFGTDDVPAQTDRCTVEVSVFDVTRVTPVSAVQGSGPASPIVGSRVVVEAVVTSLITSRDVLDGFYVQERVPDADPQTSEGLYVFCRTLCPTGLAGGDLVRVVGTVRENNGTTQVDVSTAGTTVAVVASGQALPAATVIALPAASSTEESATFERLEGMRTTISRTLAVAEYFDQAQFGEIVLEAEERSFQYTQTNGPSVAGYAAFLEDLAKRRIVLDDASNDQNDATTGTVDEPYFFPWDADEAAQQGLSTTNRFRGGDTITGLTGVMEYAFGSWRLRPVVGQDYTFTSTNPRPAAPDAVGGRLKVASFNVLNYFADIDTTASNSTGPCGPPLPDGTPGTDDCRGADSEVERVRQLDKIVAALSTIRADVFGLIEIQNDSGKATQQIVDALNAKVGPGTYDYIRTGTIGTDAIKQAFVYDTKTVEPVGAFDLLTTADDPRFVDTRNRPSLIQTFDEAETGERVTISVNHLKSKGSGCGTGDDSPLDGSGNCDLTRTQAAQALVDHLAKDPTRSRDPDFLIIGDLNSYAKERPIAVIEGAGYTNLLERFEGEDSYGYLFDGLLGDLDHALASTSLLPQVTGAGGWDINADENPLFDYNDTVRDLGEAAFERESTARPLYEADPYRSSDHDPAIVGLDLSSRNRAPVARITGPTTVRVGRRIVLSAATSSDPNRLDVLSYAWDLDGDGRFDDATGRTAVFRGVRGPGPKTVSVRVSDGELKAVARKTVTVTVK
jgi:uncharacterized protein